MVKVKLQRRHHPVVRVPSDIQDLFRIRDLQQDLARDLSYNSAGADIGVSARSEHLTRLHAEYYRRHGKTADMRRLKV